MKSKTILDAGQLLTIVSSIHRHEAAAENLYRKLLYDEHPYIC